MADAKIAWKAGQEAVINRHTVVKIDRVTPTGRSVIGHRIFEADGRERTNGPWYRRSTLELLSPEIKAEMELRERGQKVSVALMLALEGAKKWTHTALSSWSKNVPDKQDVEHAERLVALLADAAALRKEIEGG